MPDATARVVHISIDPAQGLQPYSRATYYPQFLTPQAWPPRTVLKR